MKEQKTMTDQDLFRIFGITDLMDLPKAVDSVLFGDIARRDEIYHQLLELNAYDLSYDWFQRLYEQEMAQRKKNKQDFTPPELTQLVSQIANVGMVGTVHEPTAGTGGLIISVWWEKCKRVYPWEFFPSRNMVTCWELSDRSIPLLLLNLSIRGMMGYVYHGDVLERKIVQRYILLNETDDSLGFSKVVKAAPGQVIKERK